jgi:drug/metabolite transporter (DMT)-like permease
VTSARPGRAVAALAAAGVAWGTSVPLSKAALGWLGPDWLTAARFALAATALLIALCRTGAGRAALRRACRRQVLAWGAAGLGGSVMLQNTGLARTSVTHAALLAGTAPILVAVIAAVFRRDVARPVAWAGFGVSLAGVAAIAGGRGGGATVGGDALVLLSTVLIATMTVAQGRLLEGQDPAAMTAVQFLGAALAALPMAAIGGGLPAAPHGSGQAVAGTVLAVAVLTVIGTVTPFTLFAYGQRRVSTEVAGAFFNLEPLVGTLIGILAFGDPAGPRQFLGGAAVLAGIVLTSLPAFASALQAKVGRQVRDGVKDQRRALQPGRGRDGLELGPGAVAGQHARDEARPGAQPAFDVGGGVARHGQFRHGGAAQAQQSGQRHVRPRPAAAGVGRRQEQVGGRCPAERRDD